MQIYKCLNYFQRSQANILICKHITVYKNKLPKLHHEARAVQQLKNYNYGKFRYQLMVTTTDGSPLPVKRRRVLLPNILLVPAN